MITKHENSPFAQIAQHLRQGLFLLFATLLVAGTLYTARFGIYDDILVRVGGLALGILLLLSRPTSRTSPWRLLLDLGLCALLAAALALVPAAEFVHRIRRGIAGCADSANGSI